jgi:Glycosyl hydrolases family 43
MSPPDSEAGTKTVPDVPTPVDEAAPPVGPVADAPVAGGATLAAGAATLAAIVVGMTAAAVYRRGAFYPLDAFGVVVVSLFLVAATLRRGTDRVALTVVVTVGGLAAWWLYRAVTAQSVATFLPLGASMLGFVAAFLVMRHIGGDDRTRVLMAVVAIGVLTAAAGVAGVLGHWHPLAQHAGRDWLVATTLTYPAAAAALLIIALLVSTALNLQARLVRAAICLCLTGLIGTQSHWDLLALGAGALAIPPRRWRPALWPLAMGVLGGLAVVAAGAGRTPGWLAGAAVVGVVLVATVTWRAEADAGARTSSRVWPVALGVLTVAGGVVVVMVLPLFGQGPRQPTDQGQTLAWSSSADAWRTSVLTGVGPPRITTSHANVDTYPGIVPDGYLTITAEGGLVGALLLLGAGAAVAASFRRRDVVSSCAGGAAVAFAVAGAVDFDWQLPALALLGGCVAGLAAGPPGQGAAPPAQDGDRPRGRHRAPHQGRHRRGGSAALWVACVVALVAVQLVVGSNQRAGGATGATGVTKAAVTAEPAPSATPYAPGRLILNSGYDTTDPYMLKVGNHYLLYTSEGFTFLNVPLWIGKKPGHWGQPVDVLPNLPGWAQGGLTWAPDVQKVAGGWALYFTALLRGVSPETHCIGSAFARSATGPFVATAHPFICQLTHRGSIDARVFVESDGQLVMMWKSEDNANPNVPGPDQGGYTGIYAQDLSANGRTLLGTAVKILAPTQPWESTIVEAPDMIEAWGTYWLFFSGNWYDSTAYGIGVAQCQGPFGPCTDPNPAPFLGSNLQGAGPGEESLFEDGSNVYLLYNPFKANDPNADIPRPVSMTRLGFTTLGPYLAAS